MNAKELLQKYATGQRDFNRENLQGQSFRDKDLSGADFSNANIRGTDFTDAILKGVTFDRANAGLQAQWLTVKLVPIFFVSALAGILQGYFGWWIARYVNSEIIHNSSFTLVIVIIFTYTTIVIAIGSQGLDLRALLKIAVVDIIVVAITVGVITPFNTYFAFTLAGAFAVGGAGAFAVSLADAVTISLALSTTSNIVFIGAIVVAFISAVIVVTLTKFDGAIIIPIVSFIFSVYVKYRISKKDEKFTLIYIIRNIFGIVGGTNFSGADLTGATFVDTRLKNTSFLNSRKKSTNLDLVYWKNAKMLDSAELGDCILSNPDVRKLLVDLNGYKQNFVNANFRGANLKYADLREANLTGVDMSGATLEGALLNNAVLKSTQAIGTNFSNAVFTGACLETWNIDKNTKFDQVDCEYIFQLECRNDVGSNERRPHDPDECFKKGDFEKLYRKLSNTIEVLLRDGFQNVEAFNIALQTLMQEQHKIIPETIRKIDDDVLVIFEVDENVDKAVISRKLLELYDKIQKLDGRIDKLQEGGVNDREEVIGIVNKHPSIIIQQINENKAMTDQRTQPDYSRSSIFHNTAPISNSIINIGSIIGRVENEINKIPDTVSPKLIEYLLELKEEIKSSSELPDEDKADVLEEVETLAKFAQTPDNPGKLTLVRKAIKVLKGTVVAFPGAVKFAESCAKLLPLISNALDISI